MHANMTRGVASMNNNNQGNTKHIITALEAHWYKSRHEWNEEKYTNIEQTTLTKEHPVENTKHTWEYWCACGDEFTDWENAKRHLKENTP